MLLYICIMEKDKEILFSEEAKEFFDIKKEQDGELWKGHLVDLCDTLLADRRHLEALILTFRNFIRQAALAEKWNAKELEHWLERYDTHFEIKILRHEETKES